MEFREIKTQESVIDAVNQEIIGGRYVNGGYVNLVEQKMKEIVKCDQAVAVSSGTMGLKIALDAMGVGKDDLVIVPDITFIACASVVMELGAIPVFVDVNTETFVLDNYSTIHEVSVYGDRIKAIIAVRLGGQEIPDWVYDLKIPVIIDSAHSMDPLDSRALCAVYSFHPSKIVSGIEGGLIATNSAWDAEKARMLRMFGFKSGTRIAHALGYKGNMSNVSAVIIYHNLCSLESILEDRKRVRDRYNNKLKLNNQGLGMYMVLHNNPDIVCSKIPAIRHYPITLSKMITGVNMNEQSAKIAEKLVSLPFHEWLTDSDVDIVCDTILNN